MSVLAGQSLTADFTVVGSTGALVNGDSLPTGTLVINGTDNGATVTVTNKATGTYKAAVTVPATVAIGDVIQIRVNATVSTVASGGYIFTGTVDNVSAQEIARIVYRSKQVMFVGEGGNDANDGLSPTLAKLTVAAAASAASEEATIIVEAGEYSEGTTPVDLKAGQGLYGAGMTRTRIHGTVNEATASKGIIVFADRTEVANLTGENTLADTTFGAAFSAYLLGTGAPITFRCTNVRAIADADAFYLRGTNASQHVYGYLDNCVLDAKFDALARFTYSSVTARDCKITTIGPSATGQTISRAVVSSGVGGVSLFNCDVFAKDGGGTTLGVYNTGTAIDMISNCRLFATDSAGTIADLSVASTGTARVRDTAYSTTTGTGSATVLNTMTDADVKRWLGTAAATPTTAGVPKVDISKVGGQTATATGAVDFDDLGTGGGGDATAANQALILAQVNKITTQRIEIVSHVNNTDVVINQGETYSSTLNSLTFTYAAGDSWPTDLTSYTITLVANQIADAAGNPPLSPAAISQGGSVVTPTGSTRAVRIDATAAQTALMTPGLYDYYLKATTGSGASTVDWLRQGQLRINDSNPNA